jgi:hypothetical protein
MKPVQHHTSTHKLGDGATALPFTKTNSNGQPVNISFWKPTPEEMMTLNTGGAVALTVVGENMPVASVMAVKL